MSKNSPVPRKECAGPRRGPTVQNQNHISVWVKYPTDNLTTAVGRSARDQESRGAPESLVFAGMPWRLGKELECIILKKACSSQHTRTCTPTENPIQ
jgi:hypothetical protein